MTCLCRRRNWPPANRPSVPRAARPVPPFSRRFCPAGATPETRGRGEAACFDHPGKRAWPPAGSAGVSCASSARLGSARKPGAHPALAAGSGRARIASQVDRADAFRQHPLTIPFAALLFWPLTALTAPCTVTLAAMTWKKPLSPVRRWRWRFLAGIGVSLVELGLWVWVIAYLVMRSRHEEVTRHGAERTIPQASRPPPWECSAALARG